MSNGQLIAALKTAREWMVRGTDPLVQTRKEFDADLKTVDAAIAKAEARK